MSSETHLTGYGWCEALYERKSAALLLYGRALGLSHSESEDVLQEVFVELMKRGEAIPDQVERYCVRAFRNRAYNYRRGLLRRLLRELESSRWFERGPEADPREEAAMQRLASLPAEQREVIVLKIWHGYTFEAIGELLSLSPNTAAGRYRYGMQKLRAGIEDEGHERVESVGKAFGILDPSSSVPGT